MLTINLMQTILICHTSRISVSRVVRQILMKLLVLDQHAREGCGENRMLHCGYKDHRSAAQLVWLLFF